MKKISIKLLSHSDRWNLTLNTAVENKDFKKVSW